MKFLALASVSALVSSAAFGLAPGPSDADAQRAHAQGACGKLGPGTGLVGDKGWIVSMLPGRHEFRMHGGGTAYVTVARQTSLELDAGRPYYLIIEGAKPGSVLEWKVPGSDWAPVSKYFLYPMQR